ncbi:MAG TPA: response regulator [Nitrososphaera sp.]|jgi:CheY-like chemotaxis protein|nr:response regulator [Nitrososphaera sp.]
MKILIAEDEANIATLYRIALESRGHHVTVTNDGEECVKKYTRSIAEPPEHAHSMLPPYDAVILDYRMPKMDGMDAAKHILGIQPKQRIVFASAFVKETLVESIKELDQIVELLQKPFELDVLVDTIEDKTIYTQLEQLKVNIKHLKDWNPTHAQVRDLLDGLLRLKKTGLNLDSIGASAKRPSRISQSTA